MEKIPPQNQGTAAPVKNVKPGTYLYDRSWDPEQKFNLYDQNDPKSRELLSLLNEHFRVSKSPTRQIQLDEVLIEKLRGLGYVE